MNKRIPSLKVLEWHDKTQNTITIVISLITFLAPLALLLVPFEDTMQYGIGLLMLSMGL